MAVVLAESVAITKSSMKKGFNGDSFNLNGKVITTVDADKGFKAAGKVKPPYSCVLSSGNRKGFASGASAAFNDYVRDINFNKYNSENVFEKYFKDMDDVVRQCSIEGSFLSIAALCVYDDCVFAAKNGSSHLLRFSEGELFEIAISPEENGKGYQLVETVANGDIFALISSDASANIDYEGIVKTLDSETELKNAAKDIYKILAAASDDDCSVILVKVQSDTQKTYAAVSSVSLSADVLGDEASLPAEPSDFDAQPPIDTSDLANSDDYIPDDELPKNGKSPSMKKKIISFIPIAILVIILAVTAALYLSTVLPRNNSTGSNESNSDDVPVLNFNDDNTEQGEDFNGSSGLFEVEDIEQGGEVANPLDPNGETTTLPPETTSRRHETSSSTASTEPNETTSSTSENTTGDTTAASTESTPSSESSTESTNPSSSETNNNSESTQGGQTADDPEAPESPEEALGD